MELDAEQKLAVESEWENSLVLAGPGSGKTRCITERAAYLIEEKRVSGHELLLLTFTRKAAGEMRTRIEARSGAEAHKITIGTFHAVALKILKRFGDLIGLKPKQLTVYSEFEEVYLLRDVAMDLGIYNGKSWKVPKKDIDAIFAKYYQEGIPPDEKEPGYIVFKEFASRCHENNSTTFGGLLNALKLLLPHIGQYLHWKHIIVDEAHDTDRLQWELIRSIQAICGASLYVVADENQSIYSWRGAYPEYLVEHQHEFRIFPLTNNYRSCPEIVAAANALIEHNQNRIPRTMRATREEKGQVKIFEGMDSENTKNSLRSLLLNHKIPPQNIAVLGRNHVLLDKLSEVLTLADVPHVKIGKTHELMGTPLFRIFHSFLKLVVNEYDNFSFLLIRELLGLSRQEFNEIRLKATQESKSHFQVWLIDKDMDNSFYEWFDQSATEWTFDEIISKLVSIIDQHTEIIDVERFVKKWIEENPTGTLADYLDWLAVYDLQDEIEEKDERLKLLTIHAAKGLEWPTVIVIGCNEGILPSKQSIERGEEEAERRLFYVAITRAKDALILAVRPESKEAENGKVYYNPISRFVGEIK